MNQRPLMNWIVTATLAALCGCSYQQTGAEKSGYTHGNIFRSDIRTVAIPAFGTKSFSRGDEIALTQALVTQIESRTPYKVVPVGRADTVLEGMVVGTGIGTASTDNYTALPEEHLYSISVDFTWKDLRTGQILVERRNFDQSSAYYPTMGEGRFAGRTAAAEALAASIVDELQGDW
jgi:hypothetical protein